MKKLRKIVKISLTTLGCFALFFLLSFIIRQIRVDDNLQKINTPNFTIIYNGIIKNEATEIAEALESNYNRIRTELKDPKHGRISVFIHPTQEDFNKATGLLNSKANGTSRGPLALHLKYETWHNSFFPKDMRKVAVHEFTHCVQLNILIQEALSKNPKENVADFDKNFELAFKEKYPQWFWEALCDYEANMVNGLSVNYGMRNQPTLLELNNSNQIYNVGYTIIEYFAFKYGKDKLPEFIRSYGDFKEVLGISEKEFENGWYQFVAEKY